MKNKLQTIINSSLNAIIRVITINHEPWIVGKDVCDFLDYANSRKALEDHVDDEDKMTVDRNIFVDGVINTPSQIVTPPSNGESIIVINESGFYSLVLRSNKPKAKEFKHWVTSDVLPSIRKYGSYSLYSSDLFPIKDKFLSRLKIGDEIIVPTPKDIFAIADLAQAISSVYHIDFDLALLFSTEILNHKYNCLDGLYSSLLCRLCSNQ